MPQKIDRRAQPATTFLSLSREIRQMILYESFEDALKQDIGFNTNHAVVQLWVTLKTCDGPVSAYNIDNWASTLASTNATVKDDLGYVLNNCLKELEKEYKTKERYADPRHVNIRRRPLGRLELEQESMYVGLQDRDVITSMANFDRWAQMYRERYLDNHRPISQTLTLMNMIRGAVCLSSCPCPTSLPLSTTRK